MCTVQNMAATYIRQLIDEIKRLEEQHKSLMAEYQDSVKEFNAAYGPKPEEPKPEESKTQEGGC